MGVERTDYLMFGVDVGADAYDWEKHGAESDGAPGRRFDIIYDGMSAKYCVAGKVIAESDPYEGFAGRKRIDPASLSIDREELAAKLSDAFEKDVKPEDIGLVLFSHFF